MCMALSPPLGTFFERNLPLSLLFEASLYYSFPPRLLVSLHHSPLANFGWNTLQSCDIIPRMPSTIFRLLLSHCFQRIISADAYAAHLYYRFRYIQSPSRNGAPQHLVSQEAGAPILTLSLPGDRASAQLEFGHIRPCCRLCTSIERYCVMYLFSGILLSVWLYVKKVLRSVTRDYPPLPCAAFRQNWMPSPRPTEWQR